MFFLCSFVSFVQDLPIWTVILFRHHAISNHFCVRCLFTWVGFTRTHNRHPERRLRSTLVSAFPFSFLSTGRCILFPWKQRYAGVHRAWRWVAVSARVFRVFKTVVCTSNECVYTSVRVRESIVEPQCIQYVRVFVCAVSCKNTFCLCVRVVFVFRLTFRARARVRVVMSVYIRMLVLFLGCWLCRKGALLRYQASANGLNRTP